LHFEYLGENREESLGIPSTAELETVV
jgi:hypothetical protein